MKGKVDTKVCGVCGDKALGYNFNAVTCESCKAFFRRNALIQKDFKCPFSNQCKITTVTRRFCQKCRLDKCFAIGMCKDLIMSEEDKVLKRQKIEENRAKKRNMGGAKASLKKIKRESMEADSQESELYNNSYTTDSDSKDTTLSEGYQPNNPNLVSVINYTNNAEGERTIVDDKITSTNERLVSSSDDLPSFENVLGFQQDYNTSNNLENRLNNMVAFSNLANNNIPYNSNTKDETAVDQSENKTTLDVTRDVLRDVQSLNPSRSNQDPNPIESILSEAIKLEYEAYSSIAQCNSHSRELNDAERAKLNELIVANKALLTPVDDELGCLIDFNNTLKVQGQTKTDPSLLDVINLTAIGIRRLIKMAKKINAFKNMCQEDQVALLKGGCTEIMMIISAMKYDPTKNIWKIPSVQETLNVNVNVLKLAKGNAYQELERFIRTFDPKWRADENIILILCAIVLFTPDRPRVIHQDVIKLEQNSYYYLLRRYLESIYVGCEAKSTFLKLIQKIMELHKVNEELINVLLDVNPSQVEPLLIEIFDLK
ncbi:nuclear hormone receptor HR96 [Rhynchophorus ferrugineus]|uniref:nuclear hormone receptor HR96 n=1 Tax=Rhynchophorus ferrugineus TaxID=354439 RepID=UPI003FCD2C2F